MKTATKPKSRRKLSTPVDTRKSRTAFSPKASRQALEMAQVHLAIARAHIIEAGHADRISVLGLSPWVVTDRLDAVREDAVSMLSVLDALKEGRR